MTRAPTLDELFNAWCKHSGNPCAVADHFSLTPTQLATLSDNPAFHKLVATWDALMLAYRRDFIFDNQKAAAAKLRETMAGQDPIESRRAATALARLCHNMVMCGPSLSGTARQSGAPGIAAARQQSDSSAEATFHATGETSTLTSHPSTPSPLHSVAAPHPISTSPLPNPPKSLIDQLIANPSLAVELPTLPSTPNLPAGQATTSLAALISAAGTCEIPRPVPLARASSP